MKLSKLAKKIGALAVCLTVGTVGTAFSAELDKKDADVEAAYKVGYTDGYKDGYKAGLVKGYKMALRDFRRIYAEKLKEYRELEAGKFLLKKWYISYPKVVEVPTDTGFKIVIDGCKPLRPIDDLPEKVKIPFEENYKSESKETALNGGLVVMNKPMIKVKIKPGYEKALQKYDVLYVKKGDGTVWAYFKDKDEEMSFCVKYRGACLKEE